MNSRPATVEDFRAWEKAAKSCSDEQLRHIIKQCRDAARAMRDWNPVKEGFYEDQAWTYADELRSRKAR